MYATVHWAERKSRRKRQKEGEEDTILYAQTRNRAKRVVWKCFFLFFITVQFTRETNLPFFPRHWKRNPWNFCPWKLWYYRFEKSWNFSSSSLAKEKSFPSREIIQRNFHFFFFFRRIILILIRDNLSWVWKKTLDTRYYFFRIKNFNAIVISLHLLIISFSLIVTLESYNLLFPYIK